MKKLTLLIYLCSVFLRVFSQDFYETKFKDSYGKSYTGFMVYYGESYCYMRIAFYHNDTYQVVNVSYDSKTGVEDGINYFLLIGKDPVYITKNEGLLYNPEHFVWLWDKNEKLDKPFYSTDINFDEKNVHEVDYFKPISINQLNSKYLKQFYRTDEEEYLALVGAYNDYLNPFKSEIKLKEEKPIMHLIVLANTSIGDIGASCTVDKNNFINEFEGVAESIGMTIDKHIIDGTRFSKSEYLTLLNDIAPESNDVLVFLYTGHGFRWNDQTDKYPYLDLRKNAYSEISDENSISLSSVYNSFSTKGARLTLVLANCCNSKIGVNQLTTSSFLSSMSNNNFKKSNLQTLFLKSSGSLLLSAASPGEYAWCNSSNGGFFVCSFLEAFRQSISVLNVSPDWNSITQNTIKYARQKTSTGICPNCKPQNGLFYSKINEK